METAKKKTLALPATVKLSDGRHVAISAFQAKHFVDATTEAAKRDAVDGVEISMSVLAMISYWTSAQPSQAPETLAPVTIQDLMDMDEFDIMTLMEYLAAPIEIEKRDGKTTIGKLPSGKSFEARRATGKDLLDSGKMFGEANRAYAKVFLTCKVDGAPFEDVIAVQLMDGVDFMALSGHLGSRPF